jgi:hypothetical protein
MVQPGQVPGGGDSGRAAGWYVQLYIRARCISLLADGHDLAPILGLIREEPVIDVGKHGLLSEHYHSGIFYQQPIIEESKQGVHALTVHELYLAAINMPEDRQILAKTYIERLLQAISGTLTEPHSISREDARFLYEPMHRVLPKPIDAALLSVNLMLPDRELVAQFKAFLPLLRKECEATTYGEKWHRPDFREWARLGVLPYLDLVIWAKETDTKIPYQVLEEALFPGPEGSEDRVRKTTAPKAAELISPRSLAYLRAQAILEQDKPVAG